MQKLIRDKIPELAKESGAVIKFHKADDAEFKIRLAEKLIEESKELHDAIVLCQSEDDLKAIYEEYVDLLEVTLKVKEVFELDADEILNTMTAKQESRGRFDERIIGEFEE